LKSTITGKSLVVESGWFWLTFFPRRVFDSPVSKS